jgi:hypothetical protein
MAAILSAEEVKQKHLEALGRTLGPIFHALYNEVAWLHAEWFEYRKLYAHSPERLELLNKAAGFFFGTLERVIRRSVLLHIARLTDPPRQGKAGRYVNLSLFTLKEAVSIPDLSRELVELLEDAKASSAFAREWRHRRLAHQDLAVALGRTPTPLPGVSRQHVEDALASFRAVINCIYFHYFQGPAGMENLLASHDAESLVAQLAIADHLETQRRKRIRDRRALPEDWERPPSI